MSRGSLAASRKTSPIRPGETPFVGMVHGDLTVTAFNTWVNGYGLECMCLCGTQKRVNFRDFTRKQGFDCCVVRRGDAAAYRASLHDMVNRYKNSAKKRGYDFTLTLDVFEHLAKSNCFYCGAAPGNTSLSSNFYKRQKAGILIRERYLFNGIDRIDNGVGYTAANARASCKACNYAKGKLSAPEFFELCSRVAARAGSHRDIFD